MTEEAGEAVERRAVVASSVGLHARPAALFVRAAGAQPAAVMLRKASGGEPVAARSILAVMGLGAACGDELVLAASGEGAQESVDALAVLLEQDHDYG